MFADQDVAIAFFYFDYRDQDYQSPVNVVASILKQLASHKPMLPSPIAELHGRFEKHQDHPQLQDLETTLLLTCREFRQIFIMSAMKKIVGSLFSKLWKIYKNLPLGCL